MPLTKEKTCTRCKRSDVLFYKGIYSWCKGCTSKYNQEQFKKKPEEERRRLNAKRRGWNNSLKAEVINHYGGKCECCNENNIAFLTIEHSNNNGAVHRKALKNRSVYVDLRKRNFPSDEGIKVLCWNCNCATYYLGTCPHRGL